MLPYRYSALPLPGAGKHVRLLRLSPGDFSDDLHVELEQVLLDGTSTYEALSYVWGSPANPVSILVGPSRGHTISVTQNLATALRYLRYANESRTLWVDAVCIDQSNLNERSYQVTLMGDIYRAALQVVVWLGPEEDDSFDAFDVMRAIGSCIDVDWISHSFKPKAAVNDLSYHVLVELRQYTFRNHEAHAVNRLLHRQWFERLWIRQEIGLATKAIVRCGELSMPWLQFTNAILFIYRQGGALITALGDQSASFISRILLVHRICQGGPYHLETLRTELAHTVCADPRDRIYGVLSLLHPSLQGLGIIPNYSRDVALVYQDVTLRFIEFVRELSVLHQCELQDIRRHMPTWVPDWSIDSRTTPIPRISSNASANFNSIATDKGGGILRVVGVAIATIQDVIPICLGDREDHFQTMLTFLCSMIISNSPVSMGLTTSQVSAACDALCCGLFRHAIIPIREDFPDFKSVIQTFKSKMEGRFLLFDDVDSKDGWAKYQNSVEHLCRNRSFFVTTEGSVGIAPLSARPDDIVCVIMGCHSAIILRQTGAGTYQVVGESYTSGINTGETLLGPLPEHLRQLFYYDEHAKRVTLAFRNERTGEVQYEDPRLDKLLLNPGFQAHDHGKDYFPTIETSVEALRNAGIAAQYFDLV